MEIKQYRVVKEVYGIMIEDGGLTELAYRPSKLLSAEEITQSSKVMPGKLESIFLRLRNPEQEQQQS